jgi:glycosyltransferase involved in cell wall biosynthesis
VITFLIPTIGRPSLVNTLQSIGAWPGDEILVVGGVKPSEFVADGIIHRFIPCLPGNDWGHAERNTAMPWARGRYIAHIDDDDRYAPGTRRIMEEAIEATPDRPVLFRMRFPNGITLWRERKIACGNVGTPMMLMPNMPDKFGFWGSFVGGDCNFLETSQWDEADYVWRPEVIALLGHNT